MLLIANEPLVRGRTDIEPGVDPPPDLAIEVEISRSVLDRIGIYAALGVPELWRFDGQTILVNLLGANGQYAQAPRSLAFPFLPLAELTRFINDSTTMSETKLLRTFRAWVRQQNWLNQGPAGPG